MNLFLREVEWTCNVVLASDLRRIDSVVVFFFCRFFSLYGASPVDQIVKNLPALQETQV